MKEHIVIISLSSDEHLVEKYIEEVEQLTNSMGVRYVSLAYDADCCISDIEELIYNLNADDDVIGIIIKGEDKFWIDYLSYLVTENKNMAISIE